MTKKNPQIVWERQNSFLVKKQKSLSGAILYLLFFLVTPYLGAKLVPLTFLWITWKTVVTNQIEQYQEPRIDLLFSFIMGDLYNAFWGGESIGDVKNAKNGYFQFSLWPPKCLPPMGGQILKSICLQL